MKKFQNLLLVFLIGICTIKASAQNDTCIYTLQLIDFFGDGWDGAKLTAIIQDDTIEYTLPDSTNQFYEVKALRNERLQFFYSKGAFDDEVSYILYEPDGTIIFNDGPFPKTGLVIDLLACPSCPLTENINVNTNANTGIIHWNSVAEGVEYIVEYGLKGLPKDSILTINTRDTFVELTGLKEATEYEFALSTICTEQDTSIFQNRERFRTRYFKDVGISAISMPNTACNLTSAEMISLELKNFGANPQTLIPFNFSVNGMDGGVMMPNDGFFTNILSKDSIAHLEFEMTYDFSPMGAYEVAVWTELDGDSNSENDTAYLQITSIPNIRTYPYSQDFETNFSGWVAGTGNEHLQWQYGQLENEIFNNFSVENNSWFIDNQGVESGNRLAYLISPCLDFSNLIEAPKVAFHLLTNDLDTDDKLWLEIDTSGLGDWKLVETDTSANLNWYNNTAQNAWEKTAAFQNWVYVENRLNGVEGQSQVRLRLVFEGAMEADTIGGIAIDNFQLFSPNISNVVALATTNNASNECGSIQDLVTIQVYNAGSEPATNLEFFYQINDGEIIKERADTFEVMATVIRNYQFKTPFNSSLVGDYTLKTWIQFEEEALPISNTVFNQFSTAAPLPLPLIEDLEDEAVHEDWFDSERVAQIFEPFDHNNPSYVIGANLWSSATKTAIHTANYGPIQANDSLSFDYRLSLYISGEEPLELDGDSLQIEISTDCGASFQRIYSINTSNHFPTAEFQKISLDLSPYIGQKVQFKFVGIWGHDDYWLDLDNISIMGGRRITTIANPEIVEHIRLFPNPSQSMTNLELSLQQSAQVKLEIFNTVGQILIQHDFGKTNDIDFPIHLNLLEAGVYFVKIDVDKQSIIRKVIKVY